MFKLKIRCHLFIVLLVLLMMSQAVNASAIGPESVYDPDNPQSIEPSLPGELSPQIPLVGNPVSHQFDMDTTQTVALINTATNLCESAGLTTRSWDTDPLVLTPTADTELSVTLDATTIPLNPTYPIVNILLYSEPRDPLDFCLDLLDTASKTTAGLFAGALQQPGETYTFTDPQTATPIILEANHDYYLYAHVSASYDTGTADVTFTTSAAQSIPALAEWGMIFMSLILAGSAFWMIRRRQES